MDRRPCSAMAVPAVLAMPADRVLRQIPELVAGVLVATMARRNPVAMAAPGIAFSTMSLKSQIFTSSGTFTPTTSAIWVKGVGGGGGASGNPGKSGNYQAIGGGAGGAGECCGRFPIPVTIGSPITINIGGGGAGGIGAVSSGGSTGTATSVAGFALQPGLGAFATGGSTTFQQLGASGGGVGAQLNDLSSGTKLGRRESPSYTSGANGGNGGSGLTEPSGGGGRRIGQYSQPGIVDIPAHNNCGGGGACTEENSGGLPGDPGSAPDGGNAPANSGGGGGGACGTGQGPPERHQQNGGNGGSGYVVVSWIES